MFCKLYTIEVKGPNMCEPCRHHAMRRGYADPFSPITRPCISYLHMIPKGPLFIPMQPKPSGPCQPREPQAGPWEYVPSHLYPDFWNHRPGARCRSGGAMPGVRGHPIRGRRSPTGGSRRAGCPARCAGACRDRRRSRRVAAADLNRRGSRLRHRPAGDNRNATQLRVAFLLWLRNPIAGCT